MNLPWSGGPQPLEVVNMEGSSASEVHDLCTCSTLYNTAPNMPSMSGEYHNESRKRVFPMDEHPWAVKNVNG